MSANNFILNRLFTRNLFLELIKNKNNKIYESIVNTFVPDSSSKENRVLLGELYKMMSKHYRNEYIYQNILLNKLLLGRHSINTTTALTQISIGRSKADFLLINGKAVVYEIKTELDSFERLNNQILDYYKSFDHVCVVTCEDNYEKIKELLIDSPVGIYILSDKNKINFRKEPVENRKNLDATTIFKMLRKKEFENILVTYYGYLPKTSQVFYYDECLELFKDIPLVDSYKMVLVELKKRNKRIAAEFSDEFRNVPTELKSLIYFSKYTKSNYEELFDFLQKKFGG